MKTSDWTLLIAVLIWGWICLFSELYEMGLNCFLTAAILISINNKN